MTVMKEQEKWKLGVVVKTFPGEDGRVRRVQVQYKNPKPGEAVNEYHGRGFVTVERAVNKLVVLIPLIFVNKSLR